MINTVYSEEYEYMFGDNLFDDIFEYTPPTSESFLESAFRIELDIPYPVYIKKLDYYHWIHLEDLCTRRRITTKMD